MPAEEDNLDNEFLRFLIKKIFLSIKSKQNRRKLNLNSFLELLQREKMNKISI